MTVFLVPIFKWPMRKSVCFFNCSGFSELPLSHTRWWFQIFLIFLAQVHPLLFETLWLPPEAFDLISASYVWVRMAVVLGQQVWRRNLLSCSTWQLKVLAERAGDYVLVIPIRLDTVWERYIGGQLWVRANLTGKELRCFLDIAQNGGVLGFSLTGCKPPCQRHGVERISRFHLYYAPPFLQILLQVR